MTIMDGLTQIHNKRYLFEALEREMIRARRHERDLSVLMFDIDHFKRINDQYGHLAGDYVLRELARIVQERIRRDEVFARYGGEEFAIVLPETPLEGAAALAENLRAAGRRARLRVPGRAHPGHDQHRLRAARGRQDRHRPDPARRREALRSQAQRPQPGLFLSAE